MELTWLWTLIIVISVLAIIVLTSGGCLIPLIIIGVLWWVIETWGLGPAIFVLLVIVGAFMSGIH